MPMFNVTKLAALLVSLAALLCLAPSDAQAQVKASLVAADKSVQPNHTVKVALRLEHAPHWHSYWINAGLGYPTTLQWDMPAGWSATGFEWPTPSLIRDKAGNVTGHGYDGIVYLPLVVQAPADAKVGGVVALRARAKWLMCNDVCIPGGADVSIALPVTADKPTVDSTVTDDLAKLQMPRQRGDWTVAASRSDGTVQLTVSGQGLADVGSPHFISEDGYIQYDKPQDVHVGEALRLMLPIADGSEPTTSRLVGLLTYMDKAGAYVGVSVDAPFNATPAAAPAVTAAAAADQSDSPRSSSSLGSGISQASLVLLAFVGGLILNLMPCVFPVLAIKILGFVNEAGNDRRKVVSHSLMFTLGVLVSFWALAGVLAILRTSGQQLGWGFQLQSAPFVFGLAVVMLIFAMNLSGAFEFGLRATSVGSELQQRGGALGSFFAGCLATVVATPCSAPFLAPALGAALTLPVAQSFGVFTIIGLGLSTPYLLLALFPQAIQVLPRPGAWMNTFKQLMAFPLYAAVAYLVWVLAGQTTENGLLAVLFGLIVVALAAWFYGHYQHQSTEPVRDRVAITAALLLALGFNLGYPSPHSSNELVWEKWSPDRVAQLRSEGRPIYVDFTARWCATCQANKKVVFASPELLDYMRDKRVAALKADWTNADPLITAELAKWKRDAVPFNLIYQPRRSEPVQLPEVLTPAMVLAVLKDS